jgi:radical SAM superfamily enzyme with C-terminal helix-hairpin-helix motif
LYYSKVTTNFDGCKVKLLELDGIVNEISQLLQMYAPPSKLQGKIDQLKSKFETTQEFIVSLEKLDPRILQTSDLEQKEEDALKSLKIVSQI